MDYILLIGAALNYSGSLKLLKEAFTSPPDATLPEEYFQIKLFVVGVAATFGSLYLYLFFNTQFVVPFLIFGAALKAWAFLTCLYLLVVKRIQFKLFFEFGILNGIVAVLFACLIVHHS